MKFIAYHGDILDVEADGLVSSGNIHFNMSGGINGALLQRYGRQLQEELHQYMRDNNLKYVEPGHVHLFKQKIGSYKAVTYSVGIDAWYESSTELVQSTLHNSFKIMESTGCKSVVFGALGTGFGHLSKVDFGKAVTNIVSDTWNFDRLILAERDESGLEQLLANIIVA